MNSKHAMIIHGYEGRNTGNWFPWLKKELEKLDFQVDDPQFPESDYPQEKKWTRTIQDLWKPENDTSGTENKEDFRVMIGHSLGGTEILRALELNWKKPIDLAIIVGAPNHTIINHDEFADLKNFFEMPFDFKKIQKNCKKFILIFSDNDPFIRSEIGPYFQDQLTTAGAPAELFMLHNAGHLMKSDGYEELPILLELVKKTVPSN